MALSGKGVVEDYKNEDSMSKLITLDIKPLEHSGQLLSFNAEDERHYFRTSRSDLRKGWYRIKACSTYFMGLERAVVYVSGQGAKPLSMRLPFGLNGQLDHIFFLPKDSPTLIVSTPADTLVRDIQNLSIEKISSIWALVMMGWRVQHYLRNEGSNQDLKLLQAAFPEFETALSSPAKGLEQSYQRIKQRMVRRSLPIRDYSKWKSLHRAAWNELAVKLVAKVGTVCPVSVIVEALASSPAGSLQKTLDSIKGQMCAPDSCHILIRKELTESIDDLNGMSVQGLTDSNTHLSAIMTKALERITTKYFCVLRAGDSLAPESLVHLVHALESSPEAVCAYGDEESKTTSSRQLFPHFKPDFDPVLLFSADYIGQGALFDTEAVKLLLPLEGEDFQSVYYDLALRVCSSGKSVGHVPFVLKCGEGSPKGRFELSANQKEVAKKVARQKGSKLAALARTFGDEKDAKLSSPLVSIIIPTKDGLDLLTSCIDSIEGRTTYERYELIVIDNGSREKETQQYLTSLESEHRAKVIRVDEPFNYSRLNNKAVKVANGEVLAFLNNDIEVIEPSWLRRMVDLVNCPDVGAVGAKLLYPDGRLQHAGVVVGLRVAGHPWKRKETDDLEFALFDNTRTVSANTGACLVVRKDVFKQVGCFDEKLQVTFNDIDLCLKIEKAGFRNVWTPHAVLTHHESVSRGKPNTEEKRKQLQEEARIMRRRWASALKQVSHYSPNLTDQVENGELALFPRHLYPK